MTQDTFDFYNNNGDGDFPDSVKFGVVRHYFRDNVDEGVRCPCCGQFAKVYRRKLNRTMVKALHTLQKAGGYGFFVHAQSFLSSNAFGGDVGKLRHWGLVEELQERRDDGGRAGYWKVTQRGLAFLAGIMWVPKYAHLYDGRLLRHSGDNVSIAQVAVEFRLDDLMNDK